MTKEVSPAEYERMVAAGKVKQASTSNYTKQAAIVAAVIVLCGISFVAGEGYQRGHSKNSSTTTATRQFGPQGRAGAGGFGNRQRPTVGQVTAIASDSITINNNRTGSSQTFKITSTTTVTTNGSTGSASDIKTGDTVFVQTSTSDTSTASRIIVNPATMQGSQDSSSSSSTSDNNNSLTN
jgi:hypothetical protein